MYALSDDEVFAFIVSGIFAVCGAWVVILPLVGTRFMRPWWGRWGMIAALAAGMGFLLAVILNFSAKDVRADARYVALFMTEGFACVMAMMVAMPATGIRWRADAQERRNGAAAVSVCGAILGCFLLCAGSNIGEGATIWSTIGPGLAGLLIWYGIWLAAQVCANFSSAVALERDVASGIRLGAMLAVNGLVLGRAIAGDWVSVEEMWQSLFAKGWPVVVFAGIAVSCQWMFRPRVGTTREVISTGVLPAATMILAAVDWVILLGRW